MKILHISAGFILILSLFIIPAYAIISPGISYLSNDQIMSQVLSQGKIDVSAKLEYWSADEYSRRAADYVMYPIANARCTYNIWNIPLRFSYGLTDNLSLRLSTQFIQIARTYFDSSHDWKGYGLGDSKIEMLYQAAKETSGGPSIALNFGADILSGKSSISLPTNWSDTSIPTGLNTPKYYLSGIFGKKMGAWNGKTMLGYVAQSAYKYSNGDVYAYAHEIISSLCMSTAAGENLEYGGEISGAFSGEDNMDYAGGTFSQEFTPVTKISISPFITYKQAENISWKAVVEIPVATKGNASSTELNLYEDRGVNISIGAEMMI